ncbi:MAG: cell division protein SepF [Methanosarcinaceae archaeon]|nr:cell division protein SepF [Methanosarcinaceae archaeon]
MVKFLKKIFESSPKVKNNLSDYTELDLGLYEENFEEMPAETYIKIAEISKLEEMHQLKKEIYNGNILIIDISKVQGDKILVDRVIKDLQEVVNDVQGDIVAINNNQIIASPMGVRIDRSKMIGGY